MLYIYIQLINYSISGQSVSIGSMVNFGCSDELVCTHFQENKTVNEGGATEIKVDTVDYRSPPGKAQEPRKENVEVTHIKHADDKTVPGGGVIAEAVAKVAEKIQSTKETISARTDGTDHEKNK